MMRDHRTASPRTHLFTVRLWTEEMGSGNTVMRGEARHVLSGAMCYFQAWETLATFLAGQLLDLKQPANPAETTAINPDDV